MRFPAIAIVVVGHLTGFFITRPHTWHSWTFLDRVFIKFATHAGEGVLLFFVISGFVLALPFAREHLFDEQRVSLRAYFLRRLTRLEPPYLLSLLLFLGVKLAGRHWHLSVGADTTSDLLRHFAASATYLHNAIYGSWSTINGVAWSLEIEIQFYLLVPLLTSVFRIRDTRRRRLLLVAAILLALALKTRYVVGVGRVGLSIAGHIHYFLVGFLLADIYLVDRLAERARTYAWDMLMLAAALGLILLWDGGIVESPLLPLLAFGTFLAAFRGRISNRVVTNAYLTTIGGMCYSIYLMHAMVMYSLGRVLFARSSPSANLWIDVVGAGSVLLAAALAASVLMYVAVEHPCMDKEWPKRLSARWRLSFSRPSPAM